MDYFLLFINIGLSPLDSAVKWRSVFEYLLIDHANKVNVSEAVGQNVQDYCFEEPEDGYTPLTKIY